MNWTIPANDLDPVHPDNNGYQNEHFIVWMRTAAFPSFRKLWGRIEMESILKDKNVLPRGTYTFHIDYSKFLIVVYIYPSLLCQIRSKIAA